MSEELDSALLSALLEAAADAIVVADGAGRILRANPAAETLFGHPAESLVGESVDLLMPKSMADLHDGFMKHHMTTGEKRIIGIGRNVEGLRRDGTVFPLRLSIGKAMSDGAPIFIAILHDLSRQQAAERAMLRSQRMDAIGQMTGGISHDFNNILTVIIGNLELLDMTETEERAKPLIRDALEAAEIGSDLTSRLMVFARKTALVAEPTDIEEVLDTSVRMLARTVNPQCRIIFAPKGDTWKTMIDPTRLHTAILNLVLNAQDAMPDGGDILLEVANVTIDDAYMAQELDVDRGDYVRVTVSDTGEGMSEDVRAQAMEPFFTTKPQGKGTGLGLSMVYGFVKQSGGHFTIYSEPGEGTKMSLYFPAIDDEAEHAIAEARDLASEYMGGSGQRILVVEDDPRVRRLSELRLTALGYSCVTAPDATAAWDLLNADGDIDLVFSDLVMPGKMTGYDLAQRISATFPAIRILLTSGFSEAMLKSGRIGRDYPVLGKPYRQEELAAALRNVFGEG